MNYHHTTASQNNGGSSEAAVPAAKSSKAAPAQQSETTTEADEHSSESSRSKDIVTEVHTSDARPPNVGEKTESERFVLIPVDEYRSGTTARVVERLPMPIVVELLELPNGETVPVLSQPDEYTGYVLRSEFGNAQVRSTTIVFTRESLERGARYVFEADAQVFSTRLYLLRTTVHRVE